MLVAALTALVLTSGTGSGTTSALVDAPLMDYYSRAVSAWQGGESQKALGMLRLLLIPPGTEVAADYSNIPGSVRPRFQRGVERAFNLWGEALGADFPFKLTPAARSQNVVRLTFVQSMPGSNEFHKGEIKTTRRIQWNREIHNIEFVATVVISMYATGATFMTEDDITHVMAHELGHALGLGDAHTLDRIMGPVSLGKPYARLNTDEVQAVRDFRRMIRNQIDVVRRSQ